jgi:hypothetical protein
MRLTGAGARLYRITEVRAMTASSFGCNRPTAVISSSVNPSLT